MKYCSEADTMFVCRGTDIFITTVTGELWFDSPQWLPYTDMTIAHSFIHCCMCIPIKQCISLYTLKQKLSQWYICHHHYIKVIMSVTASQITSLTIVYSTVDSGADQRKHQSSASLAFLRGIHWWLVNSPHKGPVTQKMFPFDDVIITGCTGGCHVDNLRCKQWWQSDYDGDNFHFSAEQNF